MPYKLQKEHEKPICYFALKSFLKYLQVCFYSHSANLTGTLLSYIPRVLYISGKGQCPSTEFPVLSFSALSVLKTSPDLICHHSFLTHCFSQTVILKEKEEKIIKTNKL